MSIFTTTPGFSVAVISAVTAIVTSISQYIINYKPNKKIDKLAKEIKSIREDVNEQKEIVSYYAAERSVSIRLNGVRNHAVVYASNEFQKDFINQATEDIKDFVLDLIKTDIASIPDDVLMLKINKLKNDAISFLSESQWSLITDDTVHSILTYINIFSDNLLSIKRDKVNNKISRVINKAEDLLQEVSRCAIVSEGIKNV